MQPNTNKINACTKCGKPAEYGYKVKGELQWFCEQHRLSQNYADARGPNGKQVGAAYAAEVKSARVIEIVEDGYSASIPAVMGLVRRISALIERADKAADKAEQLYKAAGLHIKEVKEQAPLNWESIVQCHCNIGRSRAYELMAIADGRTSLEKVRADNNERKKVHRAKTESVPERTEPAPPCVTNDDAAKRAEARCAAQWRAFTAEEERNAERETVSKIVSKLAHDIVDAGYRAMADRFQHDKPTMERLGQARDRLKNCADGYIEF